MVLSRAIFFACALAMAAPGAVSSRGRGTSPIADDSLELTIECVQPELHETRFDGLTVTATRDEYSVLQKVEGITELSTWCRITYTLSNETDESYLLDDWGFRGLVLEHASFTDDAGRQWSLRDTYQHSHPDGFAFVIPSIAGTSKTAALELGTCRLVCVTETPGKEKVAIPEWLNYEIVARLGGVTCRRVDGSGLAPRSRVMVKGKGRCRVEPQGCR